MTARCRHRDTWLIAGGTYEWCYRCGAFRRMRETGIAQCSPMSPWLRPVGATADNPWEKWNAAAQRYVAKWTCPHLDECTHRAMCEIKANMPAKYPVREAS